jgi:hypothetical protein
MPHYTYDQLIESYFGVIKKRISKFTTEACRKYVKQYKKGFDDQVFLEHLAVFLVELDDQLSDYSDVDSDD